MNTLQEKKIEIIAEHFARIMTTLGLDLENESLGQTPERVARMYVSEIFSGLDPANFPEITLYPHQGTDVVLIRDIEFTSYCEHHFVPMTGTIHIAYIPNGQIIGLSKINRLVRFYSQKPQLQERLTGEIASGLSSILETPHVAVLIEAQHFCVTSRGVRDGATHTTTYTLLGDFDDNPKVRSDFFSIFNNLL